MKVAVIGTGYVGLTTAVSLAIHGHEVFGIDVDADKINNLKQGLSPIYEPGLEEALVQMQEAGDLHFSTDLSKANGAEIMFVCVGTPEAADGTADLSYLLAAVADLERMHSHSPLRRVLVIKSTVPVGTGDKIAEMLCTHADLSVVSNPEFLREGNALMDALKPSRIVIGASDATAADSMERLYEGVSAPRVITTRANAELIKYASNAFLATRISFMNELARVSAKLGTDITIVAQGMGLDSRIGPEFLRAGVGYGGSCFPKDTIALLKLAKQNDVSMTILEQVRNVNATQPLWFVEQLQQMLPDLAGKQIAVLGLAFKPDTDDIREAPALIVLEALQNAGARISAYDPVAFEAVRKVFPAVHYASSPTLACEGAHAALLLTEWKECTQLDWDEIKGVMASPYLLDGRNAWPSEQLTKTGFTYKGVGKS